MDFQYTNINGFLIPNLTLGNQPTQPLGKYGMIRNPKDHQAWQLIEEIGMRGTRIGGAMVSEKHANFIVNEDHARAEDVVQLVEVIQKEVQDRFGVELITEVEKFNWKI